MRCAAACVLATLLLVQCMRLAAGCSHEAGAKHTQLDGSVEDTTQQQRRHLHQADAATAASQPPPLVALPLPAESAANVTVKHLKRRECAQVQPDEATQQQVERRVYPHTSRLAATSATARAAAPVMVNVHVHIIRAEVGDVNRGDVPTAVVQQQITALNTAYRAAGFQFRLLSVSRTTNSDWFYLDMTNSDGKNTIYKMRSALHKGPITHLNMYSAALSNDMLGVANYPWGIGDVSQDGVIVHYSSLPGQGYVGYNLGMTAVHEIGHWLGLYHPFSGGCSAPNDYIADTGRMAGPNYDCVPFTKSVSTCTNRGAGEPNVDPSWNYLGYAPDACMNRFTTGQAVRMQASWAAYRAIGSSRNGSPTPAPRKPTRRPTRRPMPKPTRKPTPRPTLRPTPRPTRRPTPRPTRRPSPRPTRQPTPRPTHRPSRRPTRKPTAKRPTSRPTRKPTARRTTPRPTRHP